VKERRTGALGVATAVAEAAAAAMRRRQREREPRVLLYGPDGRGKLLPPGAHGYDRLLDVSERMVDLVEAAERRPPPWRRAETEPDAEVAPAPAAEAAAELPMPEAGEDSR
jgi:hypothetical protein